MGSVGRIKSEYCLSREKTYPQTNPPSMSHVTEAFYKVYCIYGIVTMNQLSLLKHVIDFELLAVDLTRLVFLWGPAAQA